MFGIKHFSKRNLFDPAFSVNSLTESFTMAWEKVYLKDESESGSYKRSWLNSITNFFGLPFFSSEEKLKNIDALQTLDSDNDFSALQYLKQPENLSSIESHSATETPFIKSFFGWDEERFLLPINILRSLLITPLNLLLIVPRLILNLVKLITEFTPLFVNIILQNSINEWIDDLKPNASTHWVKRIFIGVALVLALPLYFASKLLYAIGRAITSPHQSLSAAWEAGGELAGDGILGKAVSVFFTLISLALTTLIYLVLFPLGIKLLITYGPSIIATGIQSMLNFLAPISFVGTAFETISMPIFNLLGITASMPIISGLAGIIGLVTAPFMVLCDKLEKALASLTNWWRKDTATSKNKIIIESESTNNHKILTESESTCKLMKQPEFDISFRVLSRRLGEGGFSEVYEGQYIKNQQSEQTVAIKILKPDVEEYEWQDEFKVHSQLDSPYIVKLIVACQDYRSFVMEYMIGGSLDELLRRNDFPDTQWQIRYQIAIDITFGVSYLHALNIIHADLKSPNILLDSENRAKITDFGVSTDEQDSVCSRGSVNWAAPEVVVALKSSQDKHRTYNTKKSDVYSYAWVLWELGEKDRFPFQAKSNENICSLVTDGQREKISDDTPIVMKGVISQCWKTNPDERLPISKALEQLNGEFQSGYQVKK